MIILVTGGRDYSDRKTVFRVLDELARNNAVDEIVHGGAKGADALANEWGKAREMCITTFPVTTADWMQHGRSAGPRRNGLMVAFMKRQIGRKGIVVAFPGGNGTADCVRQARAAGVSVLEIA